ncbi:hypothetical protein B0T10DRAFT_25682 [Thelonectria olida]|uniref:Uncharacterized protein n=1 Tax=Thelonectria olida TaxID=1576542 RepID=A0A9P8WIZ7_9HYPO|nr:hypothetical protein B0T10DRAFT_25682 [Thelonectria olida]
MCVRTRVPHKVLPFSHLYLVYLTLLLVPGIATGSLALRAGDELHLTDRDLADVDLSLAGCQRLWHPFQTSSSGTTVAVGGPETCSQIRFVVLDFRYAMVYCSQPFRQQRMKPYLQSTNSRRVVMRGPG